MSNDFILREIAGEHILVPVGAAAARFNGLITMNEIGALIVTALAEEQTEQSLVKKIREEYDVGEAEALADLREYLQELRELGALREMP